MQSLENRFIVLKLDISREQGCRPRKTIFLRHQNLPHGEWGLQESLNLGKEKRNYSAAPSRFCLVALEMNIKPAFDHSPNPSPHLSLDWEPDFQLWRKGKDVAHLAI